MIISLELGLVLVALALAFAFPQLGSDWFDAVERAFARLAEKPRLAVAVTGLAALVTRAALLPILPIPHAAFHDEFCYQLAADTFAHGRLANPPHPMWIHFETYYVIWHPVYASMFPPAQGLIMGLGQSVLGHPFWGVWLSLGLMCAAITWMLQGWLPPEWALLGGMLAVIRLATFSYWANSYWGGAMAAAGGALVFGALPRLKKTTHATDAVLLALGLGILANSRPYEGLVISLPVLVALLVWMFGMESPGHQITLRRVVLPLGITLGIVAVLMGYYFWRVTGSPWQMPHSFYDRLYHSTPYFIGQTPPPLPNYRHWAMQDFYIKWELPAYTQTQSLVGLLRMEATKAVEIWTFFALPLLTLPFFVVLATLPYGFSWRQISPGTRFLLVATGVGLAGYALEVQFHPHYVAPGTCLVFALTLTAMRRARNWKCRERSVGLAITRAIPVIAVTLFLVCVMAGPSFRPWQPELWTWCSPSASELMADRAHVVSSLAQEPGGQLVIVRYSPTHQFGLDWVYNAADIDNAKVVWARDMGREQNAELLNYFHHRRVWLMEPDTIPPRLSPYFGE